MKNDLLLVSSGYDQKIRFWNDLRSNKCEHVIEYKESVYLIFNQQAINALEITLNKKFLAFGVQNSIKFIDLATMYSVPVL